jgi:hypothetical protein
MILQWGGNTTSAICEGGVSVIFHVETEEYNGTAWSEGGDLPAPRRSLAGGGNPTDAICMGGDTSYNSTYEYAGVSSASFIPAIDIQFRRRWS